LAESDDEEFFRSKPVTKTGRDYELDFKIDTFRDEIKLSRHGSKKVIGGRSSNNSKMLQNPSVIEVYTDDDTAEGGHIGFA